MNVTHSPADVQVEPSNWLSPKDLQRELQIGEKLAYRLIKRGTVPSVRVGGLIRIYRPQLEAALLEDLDLGEEKGSAASTPGSTTTPAKKEVSNDSTR